MEDASEKFIGNVKLYKINNNINWQDSNSDN